MHLLAGQRYLLENEKEFAFINSGKAEVYAVTRDSSNFRQICLFEMAAGAAVYPALDEEIEILIYALEECEIYLIHFNEQPVEVQIPLMQLWFNEISKVSWFNLLADGGDKNVISWRTGLLFADCDSIEKLLEEFLANEKIFSALTNNQFKAEDTRFTERLAMRRNDRQLLLDNSINRLIGEAEVGKVSSTDQLNDTVFIVREVAKALSMNTENISIAPEFVKRLDQVGIIRRLMQKGNMHLRFVTFEEDWYNKDSGVIIGWYGEELAAFIPQTPHNYKLITNENPAGVVIDSAQQKRFNRAAFFVMQVYPIRN